MANTPSDHDPKRKSANPPAGKSGADQPKPDPADPPVPDSVPFDELPTIPPGTGLSDPELYLGDLRVPSGDSSQEMNLRATPESAVFENLKSPGDSSLFESLKTDSADESLFDAGGPAVDLNRSGDSVSDFECSIPAPESASGANTSRTAHDPEAAIGNFEPPSPVEPSSGWLDPELPPKHSAGRGEPLAVEEADLFEAPPVVESSDIFSTGLAPEAKTVEGSDVINATAYGANPPAKPAGSEHGSDVALSFDQPPGGSTIDSATRSDDLPIADEVPSNAKLTDSGRYGSSAPEYGSTPEVTQDASSILADLAGPGDVTVNDSSAIQLESPGMPRTSHPSSGTEFDLTIGEGEIPVELEAAEQAAESGVPPPSRRTPSDPDTRTVPEINLDAGQVQPIDTRLRPDDPSSIFDSINDPVVFRRPGDTVRSDDEDAAVDFSAHPGSDAGDSSSSSSSLFGAAKRPPRNPSARPKSEADFQLPAEPAGESGVLDWIPPEEEPRGDSSNILLRGEKSDQPRTEPVPDQTAPTRAAASMPPGRTKPPAGRPAKGEVRGPEASDSVEVDWVARSSTEKPAMPHAPREAVPQRSRPARGEHEPAPGKKGGLVGGLIGAGIAVAACAGIYFSGVIPNKPKATAQLPATTGNQQAGVNPQGTEPVVQPPASTIPGQTRLFAKIQELGRLNASVAAADDADVRKAREELQAVANTADKSAKSEWDAVQAQIYLGVSHQIANEREAARKVYQEGIKKFPKYAATFQGALDRLDATASRPDGVSRRVTPMEAEQLLLAIVLLQSEPAAPGEPEAGVYFWKAIKLAGESKYAEASQQIALAKAAHVKQAKVAPGGGLNPLSDPLHEIFPRSCDDLKAYWDLRAAIYSNKAIAELVKKEGPAKAVAELAKRADAAVTMMTDLKVANDKLAKAQTDYKDASEKLAKAETDFKDASTKLTQSQKELGDSKATVIKLEKDLKESVDKLVVATKAIKDERDATARATEIYRQAERGRKQSDDLVAALAKELQTAKLLGEKFDADALLAAQKSAASRATGPTLTALVPMGTMAIGGGGLAAGQLTALAERLTRSEAAAKAATAKLATETKKLQDEHAVELKKLTDGYAAQTKTLMDTYASRTTKLKEDQAGEVKAMADKFAADMKKLTDSYETKVRVLEMAVMEEKKASEALAAKFKVDLGAAMSPAQALDVWLPLLTDLRRASDADAALTTATKVLSTAPADSEDSAKARTVAGLAYFLKGDMAKARHLFIAAKATPAYRSGTGKAWVRAADVGLQSINDPLAPLRRPVEARKTDPRAAARFLDAGVKAYKAGRFADAAAALGDSVKADPTDPVAWYFLGAAKWETAGAEPAKKEFVQGAEQERLSPLPARSIGERLSPIQGAARDALTAARP